MFRGFRCGVSLVRRRPGWRDRALLQYHCYHQTRCGGAGRPGSRKPEISNVNSALFRPTFFHPGYFCSSTSSLVPNTSTALKDMYQLGDFVGAGSFGTVRQARCLQTGERVAVKSVHANDRAAFLRETECLGRVQGSKRVMSLRHVFEDTDGGFHLVSDLYTGGELFEFIADAAFKHGAVPHELAISLCTQMLRAAETCHKNGFAHLDMKPENFVFREARSRDLVLLDFGAAEPFVRAEYAETAADYRRDMDDEVELSNVTGTACYVPPEVLNGRFSSRSDVWSIGVTLYMMLTGKRPFESFKHDTLVAENSIKRQVLGSLEERQMHEMRKGVMHICSAPTTAFLFRLLEPDSFARLSATEALRILEEHPLSP